MRKMWRRMLWMVGATLAVTSSSYVTTFGHTMEIRQPASLVDLFLEAGLKFFVHKRLREKFHHLPVEPYWWISPSGAKILCLRSNSEGAGWPALSEGTLGGWLWVYGGCMIFGARWIVWGETLVFAFWDMVSGHRAGNLQVDAPIPWGAGSSDRAGVGG